MISHRGHCNIIGILTEILDVLGVLKHILVEGQKSTKIKLSSSVGNSCPHICVIKCIKANKKPSKQFRKYKTNRAQCKSIVISRLFFFQT